MTPKPVPPAPTPASGPTHCSASCRLRACCACSSSRIRVACRQRGQGRRRGGTLAEPPGPAPQDTRTRTPPPGFHFPSRSLTSQHSLISSNAPGRISSNEAAEGPGRASGGPFPSSLRIALTFGVFVNMTQVHYGKCGLFRKHKGDDRLPRSAPGHPAPMFPVSRARSAPRTRSLTAV